MIFQADRKLLRRTSRLWGLQLSYFDQTGACLSASPDTLIEVLEKLTNSTITSNDDLRSLARRRHQEYRARGLEPVQVKWEDEPCRPHLYLRLDEVEAPVLVSVRDEAGFRWQKEFRFAQTKVRFELPLGLPTGYLTLEVQTAGRTLESLIISAPRKIANGPGPDKSWGIFLPLYAVRSAADWGIGSFAELTEVARQIKPSGGQWISLLPLLAGRFENEDCDPSPYSALTRLFWNEIYLDVEALLVPGSRARAAFEAPEFQSRLQALRKRELVDYVAVYQAKKEILEILAEEFFASNENESASYREFEKLFPQLTGYAQFRSSEPKGQMFHRYVQFQMHQSLERLTGAGVRLYMDYPVGVNESGFDFQLQPELFFRGVEVGAPPEPVFQLGQGWGFPSYHPQKIRDTKYEYVRQTLRNHLRYCRILRLDHVMGLHRVYVIPAGKKPKDGVYLRYKPQEFFAIACLEASLANADLIGENLGTVPEAVNEILEKRHFKGMTVGQFLFEEPNPRLDSIPERTLLCMNTHDMPQFASFLTGQDLSLVTQLGILDAKFTAQMQDQRAQAKMHWQKQFELSENQDQKIYPRMLEQLALSQARYLLLNPEDAWNEARPQNIPGTYREVPNWRRKFVVSLEEWPRNADLQNCFQILAKARS